jgi:hypothetical protein
MKAHRQNQKKDNLESQVAKRVHAQNAATRKARVVLGKRFLGDSLTWVEHAHMLSDLNIAVGAALYLNAALSKPALRREVEKLGADYLQEISAGMEPTFEANSKEQIIAIVPVEAASAQSALMALGLRKATRFHGAIELRGLADLAAVQAVIRDVGGDACLAPSLQRLNAAEAPASSHVIEGASDVENCEAVHQADSTAKPGPIDQPGDHNGIIVQIDPEATNDDANEAASGQANERYIGTAVDNPDSGGASEAVTPPLAQLDENSSSQSYKKWWEQAIASRLSEPELRETTDEPVQGHDEFSLPANDFEFA